MKSKPADCAAGKTPLAVSYSLVVQMSAAICRHDTCSDTEWCVQRQMQCTRLIICWMGAEYKCLKENGLALAWSAPVAQTALEMQCWPDHFRH